MSARERFLAEAAQRILIKDGPYGTAIQAAGLDEADYRGETGLARDQKGNNDLVNLTQPDLIRAICNSYIAAGATILATNTFNANSISQADYGAEHLVGEINRTAARIIREAVDAASARDGVARFVAGAIGPTNKTLSLSPDVNDPGYREIDWDALVEVYRGQAAALIEGGADFVLVETVFDTLNAKAAIMAVRRLEAELGREVPLMLSMTLTDLSGRNLSGHTVEAFWHAVRHARPLTIGLNCSFGAAQLRPHVRVLSEIADCAVMVYPNAGLPNELGEYDEAPATTAELVGEWASHGQVNALGGCCGSTPEHIAAMAEAAKGLAPRRIPTLVPITRLAGLEPFTMAA
ncbi:MAG TPA: homocysteine S-methyltransferase family protein [Novosphingobium sp.]|nr:homocysteine S-methyltransferase family protein [Novosphingobium sp.]